MKILLATPAHGGMFTAQYITGLLGTVEGIAKVNQEHFQGRPGFQLGMYMLTHEALISRGRNHCAQVAIQAGWDKLFFIDADAGWTFDQFMAVATAPGDVVAGTCPLKTYPISLNYLPFQDDEHFHKDNIRSIESLVNMRNGHKQDLIPVPFVGTAFMCIDRKVLVKLAETAEPYQYPNPLTGQHETHWDFFKTSPIKKMYMSEDWGFCHMVREAGMDVSIHAGVCITHTGNHTFRAPEMVQLKPEQVAEMQAKNEPQQSMVGKATAVRAETLVMDSNVVPVIEIQKENTDVVSPVTP